MFDCPVSENDIRSTLEDFEGIVVMDDREHNKFPEPVIASGRNEIFVGRIRRDCNDTKHKTYHMFICGDQLLKGASYNAFQIFQEYIKLDKYE